MEVIANMILAKRELVGYEVVFEAEMARWLVERLEAALAERIRDAGVEGQDERSSGVCRPEDAWLGDG